MHVKSRHVFTAAGAAAMVLLSQSAQAKAIVSTIVGAYDDTCSSIACSPSAPTGLTNFASNGGNPNDNPNLYIYNTTGNSFTNVTLTLTGYQGLNTGASQVLTFGNIAPHTDYKIIWGGGTVTNSGGFLFNYDYDDEYGETSVAASYPGGSGPGTAGSGGAQVCSAFHPQFNLCAQEGNFDITFSALDGTTPISSAFGPTPGQPGFGNVQGAFVGFEGISPAGWSESTYDAHTGTAPGTLANIFTGTSGAQTNPSQVPEPATLGLFGAALGALGMVRRKRKQS